MQKKGMNLLLFGGAMLLTALFYVIVSALSKPGPVYQFFCSRGWYQPVGMGFFFFGLLLVASRWWFFREQIASIDMPLPNATISREDAAALAGQLPPTYRNTILGRRLANLLKGYARHEELGALEDRLSANDRDELDQSAATMGWIRGLPPLIGLLGTLDGLRGGIAAFSTIGSAGDLEELRHRLQLFASHASTAFDTTLLGISAAIILSAIIFMVRRSDEDHLARVDQIAEDLTRQFPHRPEMEDLLSQTANGFLSAFLPTMERAMASWLASWQAELSRATQEILDQNRSRPLQVRITTDEEADRSAYEVKRG